MNEEESTSSESSLPIKLIIHGKGYEISTEGELSLLYNELDALAKFHDKVEEHFEMLEEEAEKEEKIPTEEEVAATPTADIPAIKPVASNMGNLRALFATPWGKTPRSLAEVLKALEVNAIFIRMETVSTYLRRLVKRGELRRIEREGKWSYFQIPGRE